MGPQQSENNLESMFIGSAHSDVLPLKRKDTNGLRGALHKHSESGGKIEKVDIAESGDFWNEVVAREVLHFLPVSELDFVHLRPRNRLFRQPMSKSAQIWRISKFASFEQPFLELRLRWGSVKHMSVKLRICPSF